jgi:hypothetical protein
VTGERRKRHPTAGHRVRIFDSHPFKASGAAGRPTGLITQCEVLDGNPADDVHVAPSLGRHRQTFHHAPELYAEDRGFDSQRNVTACEKAAVKMIFLPT